jgi:oligopeptide/dipeptide ABC transporter ATP-binding protein
VTESGLPIEGSPLQQRLASAAVELFYRQGALATSVRQITEACGLTPGALYNHFDSKDQLLYVLVRDIHSLVPDPGRRAETPPLRGEVPNAAAPPSGCRFHPRCPVAEDRCRTAEPVLLELRPDHQAACHVAADAVAHDG